MVLYFETEGSIHPSRTSLHADAGLSRLELPGVQVETSFVSTLLLARMVKLPSSQLRQGNLNGARTFTGHLINMAGLSCFCWVAKGKHAHFGCPFVLREKEPTYFSGSPMFEPTAPKCFNQVTPHVPHMETQRSCLFVLNAPVMYLEPETTICEWLFQVPRKHASLHFLCSSRDGLCSPVVPGR